MDNAKIDYEFNTETQRDEYIFYCEVDGKKKASYTYDQGYFPNPRDKEKALLKWINDCLRVSSTNG